MFGVSSGLRSRVFNRCLTTCLAWNWSSAVGRCPGIPQSMCEVIVAKFLRRLCWELYFALFSLNSYVSGICLEKMGKDKCSASYYYLCAILICKLVYSQTYAHPLCTSRAHQRNESNLNSILNIKILLRLVIPIV